MDENQKQGSALFPPLLSQVTSLHTSPWLVTLSIFQPGNQNFCTVCKQNNGVWKINSENREKNCKCHIERDWALLFEILVYSVIWLTKGVDVASLFLISSSSRSLYRYFTSAPVSLQDPIPPPCLTGNRKKLAFWKVCLLLLWNSSVCLSKKFLL